MMRTLQAGPMAGLQKDCVAKNYSRCGSYFSGWPIVTAAADTLDFALDLVAGDGRGDA